MTRLTRHHDSMWFQLGYMELWQRSNGEGRLRACLFLFHLSWNEVELHFNFKALFYYRNVLHVKKTLHMQQKAGIRLKCLNISLLKLILLPLYMMTLLFLGKSCDQIEPKTISFFFPFDIIVYIISGCFSDL